MGQLRKSAVQTKAREQARKHGAEIARRHEQLTTLAEEYHAARIEADMIVEESKKKADEIIGQGKEDAAVAERKATKKAQVMLDTGEPARTVAQRLGISTAALRRNTTTKDKSTTDTDDKGGTNPPTQSQETPTDEAA